MAKVSFEDSMKKLEEVVGRLEGEADPRLGDLQVGDRGLAHGGILEGARPGAAGFVQIQMNLDLVAIGSLDFTNPLSRRRGTSQGHCRLQ